MNEKVTIAVFAIEFQSRDKMVYFISGTRISRSDCQDFETGNYIGHSPGS